MEELVQYLKSWTYSKQQQTSGYEYEKSFVDLWEQLGKKVLQASLGNLPKRNHEKKTSDPLWSD